MTASDNAPRLVTRQPRRTGRYALLGASPEQARVVWFVLHGYAQLAPRFLRHFDGIVPADCCIVAPEGLSRFYVDMPQGDGRHLQRVGATWMTRENREDDIADTMFWLDTVYRDIVPAEENGPAIGVLAFSQGVATATRWLASGSVRPRAFVVWAGGLAHDVPADPLQQALGDAQVTLVRGLHDTLMSAEQGAQLFAQLQVLSPRAESVTFDGGHHLDRTILAGLLTHSSPSARDAR